MQIRRTISVIVISVFFALFCYPSIIHADTDAQYIFINNIRIANVFKKAVSQDMEGNVLLADEDAYQIVYMPSYDHEFLVSVQDGPFAQVRLEAEEKLLEILEVEPKDACWLYIVVTTTRDVDPDQGGKNHSPAFCDDVDTTQERTPQCPNSPDVNADGAINALDHARVIANFGKTTHRFEDGAPRFQRFDSSIREDINCDGAVDSLDLSLIIEKLGKII